MKPKHFQSKSEAPCFSRATGRTVNWRTVFAVAAAMRKLQPTRLLGPARLKQWVLSVQPEKQVGQKIHIQIRSRPPAATGKLPE
jgi:hypothetical protein